jgi:hypothetical protein
MHYSHLETDIIGIEKGGWYWEAEEFFFLISERKYGLTKWVMPTVI